jgi:hypothetical protein
MPEPDWETVAPVDADILAWLKEAVNRSGRLRPELLMRFG